jgi:hypothetical protein
VNAKGMFEMEVMKLMEEVDRYLAAVDLFRAEHCEPTWRPEVVPERTGRPAVSTTSQRALSGS